jgi:hypothetical protein
VSPSSHAQVEATARKGAVRVDPATGRLAVGQAALELALAAHVPSLPSRLPGVPVRRTKEQASRHARTPVASVERMAVAVTTQPPA